MDRPYSDLVAQAEQAVSKVRDAELRRVAFERILGDLLSNASASTSGRATKPKKQVVRQDRKPSRGPLAHVEELITEDFFAQPKTISEVRIELENRGHRVPLTSLSGPLQTLCQKKRLRRQRATGEGKKQTFAYSNW